MLSHVVLQLAAWASVRTPQRCWALHFAWQMSRLEVAPQPATHTLAQARRARMVRLVMFGPPFSRPVDLDHSGRQTGRVPGASAPLHSRVLRLVRKKPAG